MLNRSRRGRAVQRGVRTLAGLLLASMLTEVVTPRAADAMCCLCRNCAGAAFCADAVANSLVCATLCVTAGCSSTLFDSVDVCSGGCDGGSVAPTVTPSSTPSASPSTTATATRTATASSTATASRTATATVTNTSTGSHTSTPSSTPTLTTTPTSTPTQAISGTPTETPTATPSGSPTPTAALSGHVLYYAEDRPVPAVNVALIGPAPANAMTDAAGAFGFSSVAPGMQTLQPTKQGEFDTAVTALDASYVLEYVAGLRTLDSDQLLAADVTGDGTVSALDGTRILQFAAGLITRFAVADACGSDWVFRPTPVAVPGQTLVEPQINGGVCVKGAIAYDNTFTPPASGQDFVAILFGDTTGNWEAP